MIDLAIHGIKDDLSNITTSDLVVMSNIEKNNIDTTLISRVGNVYEINGEHQSKVGSYAIVGCEIIKIIEQQNIGKKTRIVAERQQLGTVTENQVVGMKFRTVVPMTNPIQLLSWEFNDTMGSIGNTVFPVELSSGRIEIKDDHKKWVQFSLDKVYQVRNKKSIAFMFKGVNGKCFLKNVALVDKIGFNTKGKSDPNKIVISLKSMLFKWFDKDMAINQHLKSESPKQFLQTILGLADNEVYYADGVNENSFVKIGNIHTKEYKKVSDILRAYASCGVRFCFDRYERLKIFSDMIVDNITSQKTLQYNITDSMMNENSLLVFNNIDTESTQRQTLFDFEELNRKYVYFAQNIKGIIRSDKLISINKEGDLEVNTVEIENEELFKAVQLKDYVLFKQPIAPHIEVYGRVGGLLKGNKVVIFPILQGDKDYKLFYYGKGRYLYDNLNVTVSNMDIHFSRFDLPMIWRYTRNADSNEKYSSLMYPILPRVDAETKYETEISMSFGSAENLEAGSYAGIIEEINPIYGTWDSSKLLYNRELEQFGNSEYPPIFAMSNRATEQIIENQPLMYYTHFDNSGLLLEITKNDEKSTSGDGKLKISSTLNANSLIDIYKGEEVSRIGNRVLEVENINVFKVGDILIVENFENPTLQEEKLFDEKLSKIRWRVTNKVSEKQEDNTLKHYIFLDSNYPPASGGKKYKFARFPVDKIVYLQELYYRGNPVIEYSQEVSGFSRETNIDGDTSKDIYGEKSYSFDSKLLEKDGVKMLMGYILDNFNGVTPKTTKYTLPISVFNGIDIELYDVVTVIDTVFTHVGKDIKWLVTGVKYSSRTNIVELTLLNLNSKNTKPYDITIDDVMDYNPVEIPKYDHAGGEGESNKPNDGSGGSDEDKALGQVALAEVDRKLFRARIERVDGNYIYFKDFSGTEWEKYEAKLFPESEFAINVDGEIIFVESDRKHRAYIKKRRMYDTEESVIVPEMEVGFYVVSTMVDIDGTFYSRRVHIGDGDTFFKFHPTNGAHFKGDFVIGENNQHAGNDLWESLQKNRTFHQNTPPVSDSSYTLRSGDIWYDLDDENHVYRYNGDVWISCRDNSIISSKSSTFVQPDEPKPTEGRPINDGDTWYDTDDGNKPYVYKNGKWVNVTDGSLQDAIDDAQKQIDGTLKLLSDMASDGKLTALEKQATIKEWDIIKTEYPHNVAKAQAYGVSTTAYTNAYNDLNTYLTPILADSSTTTDVDDEIFKQKFHNYYEKEISLTGEIYEKVRESAVSESKDYADKLDQKVEQYASDGVLTPAEKADLKLEVDKIESEINLIVNRAGLFGVSIGDIWSQWNILADWRSRVLTASGNYVGDVTPFRNALKKYYANKETILDGIDKKSKELSDKALADASGALGILADIASDNKLTPSEKQFTKKEWVTILGEYPKIVDEATKFGVSITAYTNAYNDLKSYIEPLISNINTTSDIVGDTFRAKFKTYYDNRQIVLSGISIKIPEINSMQNGKMLFLDPTFKNGTNGVKVYDNSSSGLITHSVVTGEQFGTKPPNDSNKVLSITKRAGSTSPNLGGFFFGVGTRAGMKVLTKIVACIPIGFKINWASNATGTGGQNYWVTETNGTGQFKEYVHVVECGTTGSFSSTSFFHLSADDGNQTKAVTWGLSYATVFDAGANQNDYVTEALGNAKIFYSTTAPVSGMKQNDLWYDTDDGNHPHIYNGSIWVSARDKIYETEGGNKVYFQSATPPTSGVGVKDGDMWFKTNENNKMFILIKGVWTLADDALDKVNTGRIVLNGNTTINGDFKVNGKNINLTGDTSVTGMLNVYGGDKGITSYNGTTEASSTKKIIIKGGVIEFWEKV